MYRICRFISPVILLALVLPVVPAFAQQDPSMTNYETRLSGVEDAVRAMNGRVEQLEYAVHRIDQGLQRLQADNDARLSRLEAQQTALASSVSNAAAQQPAPPPPQPQPVAQQPAVAPPSAAQQAAPVANGPDPSGRNTQEQYDDAFGLLRQANYDAAEKAFKIFIERNPKDKLIDNAKYWYGETLYVRGRFDESAVAFADAYQQNPQGSKAPDSLLKLAMSLSALNKTIDACATLTELKNKYPNASPTVRSRTDEERQKLKCGMR